MLQWYSRNGFTGEVELGVVSAGGEMDALFTENIYNTYIHI